MGNLDCKRLAKPDKLKLPNRTVLLNAALGRMQMLFPLYKLVAIQANPDPGGKQVIADWTVRTGQRLDSLKPVRPLRLFARKRVPELLEFLRLRLLKIILQAGPWS